MDSERGSDSRSLQSIKSALLPEASPAQFSVESKIEIFKANSIVPSQSDGAAPPQQAPHADYQPSALGPYPLPAIAESPALEQRHLNNSSDPPANQPTLLPIPDSETVLIRDRSSSDELD